MSGLIDTNTGLRFGSGLQFQTKIGGSGLDISVFTGVLDQLSVAALAGYSVRKLRAAYGGKSLQVKRSSDSTTMDIGFTSAGDLDTGALTTFVGANDGFVVKWYDQTGNGFDVTPNGATATGPKIVSSGSINTLGSNSKPAGLFINAGDLSQLGNSSVTLTGTSATASVIVKPNALVGSFERVFDFVGNGFGNDFGNPASWALLRNGATIVEGFSNGALSSATYAAGTNYQWATIFDGSHVTFYLNQAAQTPGNIATAWASPGTMNIGGDYPGETGNGFSGLGSEFILHATALGSTDRTTLWSNQRSYYGV